MKPETLWTAVSAVATALAFFAVAWQSFLTRRALKVAHDALEVAEAVALDAARARLDSQAPEVAVRLEEPQWPPYAWSHVGWPVNPWPDHHEWHFPEKEDDRIVLHAAIVVENFSNRRVQAQFAGDLVVEQDGRARPAPAGSLWPRERSSGLTRVFLQKDFTIKELAENYEAREAGQPLPHRVVGTVTVHDDRDNGVTDTWELELTGCPVQPHETRGSVWKVVQHPITEGAGMRSLDYNVQPNRQRTYWISRQAGLRLPRPIFPSSANAIQG